MSFLIIMKILDLHFVLQPHFQTLLSNLYFLMLILIITSHYI